MTTMHRTHECPWPGCTERVPRYLWGCKEHWKLLPRELRRRCNHAWRFGPAVEHMEALEAIDEWIAEHSGAGAHPRPAGASWTAAPGMSCRSDPCRDPAHRRRQAPITKDRRAMPNLKLRPRVDEHGGFDFLKGVDPDKIIHLTDTIEVGSLEGGMASGKPSVAFCFRLPDGRVVVAETSLELLIAAGRGLAAAHGAQT